MSKKIFFIDIVTGIIAIGMLFATIITLNYSTQSTQDIHINNNGFDINSTSMKNGDYINIFNDDSFNIILIVNGQEFQLTPGSSIQYRLIGSGKIYITLKDKACINQILEINIT